MDTYFHEHYLRGAVEKLPFADTPAQNFLSKWCEINDSIEPRFVSRKEWEEKRKEGILGKKKKEKNRKKKIVVWCEKKRQFF